MTIVCLIAFAWGAYAVFQRFLYPMRIGVMTIKGDAGWLVYKEAAAGTPYSVHRIPVEEMATAPLGNYDVLFLRGMGWQPNDREIANVAKANTTGTAIYVSSATRETTRAMQNMPEELQEKIAEYMAEGDVENLRAMFKCVAHELKGHRVAVPDVVKKPKEGYFLFGTKLFEKLEDYEKHFDELYPEMPKDAPRVIMFGAFLDAYDTLERKTVDELIEKLVAKKMRVYCLMGRGAGPGRLRMIEECKPDLALYFPIGRMSGDKAVELLRRLNIPCLSAISIQEQKSDWLKEPTAMTGGYLSMAVVLPELDGVIEPTAVAAMGTNEDGVTLRQPISSRIDMLSRRVENWIKLKRKPNSEKKVAIVYYKAPGHSSLSGAGLDTVESLYNTLCRMKTEGYDLGEDFPASAKELEALIQQRGRTIGQWAIGSMEEFVETGYPELVSAEQYLEWLVSDVPEENRKALFDLWGAAPGKAMSVQKEGKPYLLVTRIQLGNVVLMPQPSTAILNETNHVEATEKQRADESTAVHGTDRPPPHFYLGAYLWIRNGFHADAVVHYGTHGSLEFTKGKSAVLSDNCWPTILIGDLPHIYPYVINNIGEAMVAKRRSSAVIVTHLTPPFTKSELHGELKQLHSKLYDYESVEGDALKEEILQSVTELVRSNDLFKEIGYKENPPANGAFRLPLEKLEMLHEYLHSIDQADITEGLHAIGRPWSEEQIQDTVCAMLGDSGLEYIDAVRRSGRIPDLPKEEHGGKAAVLKWFVAKVLAGTIKHDIFKAPEMAKHESVEKPSAMPSAMREQMRPKAESREKPTRSDSATGQRSGTMSGMRRMQSMSSDETKQEPENKPLALFDAIRKHADGLRNSISDELDAQMTALGGGYVKPSSGGDAIVNPNAVPTGRNMASIDIEQTPTQESYTIAQKLTDQIIADYRAANAGAYPRRIACTLWGGEYIRTRGVVLAQALYLMGLRPRRDDRGIVHGVEVIPSEELGRPRIDILTQTSGQFRDAAGSRIELLDKAVQTVAALDDEKYPNFVKLNTRDTEQMLKRQGHSAAAARDYATARVFGSPTGNYGTGIMGVVQRSEVADAGRVADQYIQNMNGIYRSGKVWGVSVKGLLETQMQGTDMMIQSCSSNTWGPLSLDHVFEFNTLALAVREKTGKDPGVWFSDLRNGSRPRATTAVGAIREEARTTIWNPKFIRGLQKEGAKGAADLVEPIRNMQAWNYVQPASIDESLWDETYRVYIEDKHELDMKAYFEEKSPYELQNLTSIMLESVRKGMWKPSEEVVKNLANLHMEMVEKYGAGCSDETCGNIKLHAFLGQYAANAGSMEAYQSALSKVLQSQKPNSESIEVEGMKLEETKVTLKSEKSKTVSAPFFISLLVLLLASLLVGGFCISPRNAYTNIDQHD